MKSHVPTRTFLASFGLAAMFVATLAPSTGAAPRPDDPYYAPADPYSYDSTYCPPPPSCTDPYDPSCNPGGGNPPGDGNPPDGGDNPPDGGDNPPDGGDNPPDGGDNPPDGGDNPPDGGDNPPDGGDNPPDGGDNPPDGGNNNTCTTPYVRKEIRTLSPAELERFFNAVRQLHEGSAPTPFDVFSETHWNVRNLAHFNVAPFFPFHRKFIREFEKALQQFEPEVTLPYWDWTLDADAPHLSPVFTPGYFGGNGGAGGCVSDGSLVPWNVQYNSPHCLQRSFNRGDSMSPFVPMDVIQGIMTSTSNFEVFSQSIEGTPHSTPHNMIGGDMATMVSPNDPIFWLHHCFIDKIWHDWQGMSSDRATAYSGSNFGGSSASPGDALPLYPDTTVSSVLNSQGDEICVQYEGSGSSPPPSTARFIVPNADNADNAGAPTAADGLPSLDMSDIFGPDAQLTPESVASNNNTAERRLAAPPSSDEVQPLVVDDPNCPVPEPLTDEFIQTFGLNPVAIRAQEARIADYIRAKCAQGA
jgi:tyrosinase